MTARATAAAPLMPAITYTITEVSGPMFAWKVDADGRRWKSSGQSTGWRLSRVEVECDAFNAAMFACAALAV